ncbi:hypothetical protein RN001_004965 [Aquatica leii]|uniref:Uncharacterized protein n=1 Tax=Aquatica leii TaxID=1421715 RepID=A0AAN7PJ52_9COLE|nr:hypothetical protein RN001_004965 [Aquatica leii]
MNSIDEVDKESDIFDNCWDPKHRTDSRKGLIRDAYYKQPRVLASEMRSNYTFPENQERFFVGIRRGKNMDKFAEEIGNKMIKERNLPATIEEYCTEYDSNFLYTNFDPNKKPERNTELFSKYPLYTSEPFTFYKYTLDQDIRGEARLFGHTYSKRPFKKNTRFTKEMSGDSSY